MTYQVLARKWRPRSFDTLVGQEHVVRALTHALDTQRLHHAWLFTGTRGVGKTTLSRILAKALNCEQGVSAHPCGVCQACTEIDQGRFVDYVELDAASNRGVDEMTQLLEQAVYAPSAARYKVYMIDEVHMLTGHAFNAMLKTLEEPPAHVKFILATTDPQKIPVTVLSRCLQFNLKQMTVPAIESHLNDILHEESIPAETPALRLLAQAAQGSMRDALSLTDQAIAYSAGSVSTEAVQGMLGTIDQSHLIQLLQALIDGEGNRLIELADQMLLRGLSFGGALADLAVLLSRIAIQQRVPGALPPDEPQLEAIQQLAQQLSPDHVQLYYSVVVHSRDELRLAPDEYAGFVMACMRLFALTPAGSLPHKAEPSSQAAAPVSLNHADKTGASAPAAVTSIEATVTAATPKAEAVSAEPTAPRVALDSSPRAQAKAEPRSNSATAIPTAAKETNKSVVASDNPPSAAVASPYESDFDNASAREGIQAPVIERGGQALRAAQVDDTPPWEEAPSLSKTPPVTETSPATETAQTVDAPTSSSELSPPSYDEEPPFTEEDYGGVPLRDDEAEDFPAGDIENGSTVPHIEDAVQQAVAALELVPPTVPKPEQMSSTQWVELAPKLPLSGWAAELAQQTEWIECDGHQVVLRAAIRSADDSQAKARINTVLNEYFGQALRLQIDYGSTGDDTAFAVAEAQRAQRQHEAELDAQENPFILALIEQFDAQLLAGSVRAK